MVVIVGIGIILFCVLYPFADHGGDLALFSSHAIIGEYITILGAALGALVIMAPIQVLKKVFICSLATLKGIPYSKKVYADLFMAMYELFMLGRKNGMIALEEHVSDPVSSPILSKYPSFIKNKEALEFFCDGLRPVIDGRIKADQLQSLMEVQIKATDHEGHEPIDVLTKVGDSMPGFGIVACVMGIVSTMGKLTQGTEVVGQSVASALVGTFLGIAAAYCFVNPIATNVTFLHGTKIDFLKCISSALVSFVKGAAPAMAIETARRGVSSDFRPSADELEELLKSTK
ncbi:MAG: motility-associated protein [Limisphaerales bacterium]